MFYVLLPPSLLCRGKKIIMKNSKVSAQTFFKYAQSWLPRDVSRSRDTFLSVSVSSRSRYANVSSRTLKVSENRHVSIET